MSSYYTSYEVLSDSGKELFREIGGICFSDYANNRTDGTIFSNRIINIIVHKKYPEDTTAKLVFNKSEIEIYINELIKCGFPMILSEEKNNYVISLFESEYNSFGHIRMALDFIRVLWEDNLYQLLREYFDFSEEIKNGVSLIIGLQILHIIRQFHSTYYHELPCKKYTLSNSIFTTEELKKLVKEHKAESSYSLWTYFLTKKQDRVTITLEDRKIDSLDKIKNLQKLLGQKEEN